MKRSYRKLVIKIRFSAAILGLLAATSLLPASAHALTGPYPASDVLGQPDFTSNNSGTTASTLDEPWGSTALDNVHHRLFASDPNNNRVLVYNLDSSNNLTSHSASNVIGQPDFTSHASGYATASELEGPTGLAYDAVNNRLFVSSDQEVNIYNLNGGISNGMAASSEVGQSGGFGIYNCNSPADQANTCEDEGGLAFDADHERLFVDDADHYRVLVFNVNPASLQIGENADYVIGQPNFTADSYSPTQASFEENYYGGIIYIAKTQTLLVADSYGSRILSFDLGGGISNGMNASHVIGQTDFTSITTATTASTFTYPQGLGYDPGSSTLYVDDADACRVLLFNLSGGISNGMSADGVLGQSDFTSSNCGTSQSEFYGDYSNQIAYDPLNNRIWLPDYSNSRVLSFDFVHLTTTSLASGMRGASYSQTLATAGSQGTVTFSVTGGHLPPGLSLNPTTGVINGTATSAGSYTFEISVSDNNGAIGTFTQDPQYTITIGGPTVVAPATGYGTARTSKLALIILISVGVTLLSGGYVASRRKHI